MSIEVLKVLPKQILTVLDRARPIVGFSPVTGGKRVRGRALLALLQDSMIMHLIFKNSLLWVTEDGINLL